ncbi:DUF6463 family protein [Actinomycetospora lutea]|uniref:DUF6463 family protein n=1 Tax=Actinomycetospora lutea TaxID=663604 RepID=UPI0023654800|nr:DUF6463 family protein [Actinomycetospora lutea]MDD7937159.1 DUF6463 family protein [Actinomycetospora lutea]
MSRAGRLLQVVALGHAAIGAWIYRDVVAGVARDVRVGGPRALVGVVPDRGDRATAFWFLVAAPALWTLGRSLTPGDRVAGGVLAATGVAGSVLMPAGGWPAVAAIGAWSTLGSATSDVTTLVGVEDVPAAVRARSALPGPDYLDHVSLATDAGAWGAEEWARVMFERVGGEGAQRTWRGLGLQLDPRPSPDHVAGWRIDGRGDDWVRLHAGADWGRGELVVHRDRGHVSLTTAISYDSPAGRAVWGPASAVHRRVTPGLLRAARDAMR